MARRLTWLVALMAIGPNMARPAGAAVPLEAPAQAGYLLRGVVGHSISVALPNRQGYSWHWESLGRPLFAPPYKVSYQSLASPEIWTFPLVRTGTVTLAFKLVPAGTPTEDGPETRTVELQVLTPYEAQQQPVANLMDTLLLR